VSDIVQVQLHIPVAGKAYMPPWLYRSVEVPYTTSWNQALSCCVPCLSQELAFELEDMQVALDNVLAILSKAMGA
jgi:hypothetical protein